MVSASTQKRGNRGASTHLDGGEPIFDRWEVTGFESIELLRGWRVTQEYPRHWHEEIYLCAILSGTSWLDCRESPLLVRRGALAVVAPGDIHANWKTECSFRCLLMNFDALRNAVEQFIEGNIGQLSFRSGLIEDQRTRAGFLRVHRSLQEDEPGLERDDRLFSFLHDLAVRHGTGSVPAPHVGNEDFSVRRTKTFLDEHYAERVPLHELARLTGLSAYHLHRSFRRKIGMPPHEYQLQLRVMKAKSLLRQGQSISETASLVGFVDQSHFTRHFKRLEGVTPGMFVR